VTAVLSLGTQSPSGFEVPPEGVRTLLVGSPCPVCGVSLRGRQTVCSAACRRRRSRQRKADELRVLARAARQAIEALERRLEDSH
jgi:hypothetical protein